MQASGSQTKESLGRLTKTEIARAHLATFDSLGEVFISPGDADSCRDHTLGKKKEKNTVNYNPLSETSFR